MSNLKDFANAIVSLTTEEVRKLAEIQKGEYGIEAHVATVQDARRRLTRQQRRKLEREQLRQGRRK